jgi:hypothetical protein
MLKFITETDPFLCGNFGLRYFTRQNSFKITCENMYKYNIKTEEDKRIIPTLF